MVRVSADDQDVVLVPISGSISYAYSPHTLHIDDRLT